MELRSGSSRSKSPVRPCRRPSRFNRVIGDGDGASYLTLTKFAPTISRQRDMTYGFYRSRPRSSDEPARGGDLLLRGCTAVALRGGAVSPDSFADDAGLLVKARDSQIEIASSILSAVAEKRARVGRAAVDRAPIAYIRWSEYARRCVSTVNPLRDLARTHVTASDRSRDSLAHFRPSRRL